MGLLDGKTALIFGVANDHSIAWGIARALHAEGAEVGFSSVESLIEKRVRPLADVDRLDLRRAVRRHRTTTTSRASSQRWGETHDSLDILVHALAFAKPRGPRGRLRRHLARGVRAGARRLGLLARRPHPRRQAVPAARVVGADAHLLRRREGRRELQRDGCREGRPRGLGALPRRGPRAGRRPRQRDQRGPGPDARGGRDRGLQADVRRVRRHRAAAGEHHARGRRPVRASTSPPTSRAP